MILRWANTITIMSNNNLTPVLGHGAKEVIGHWNESENRFIPASQEIMENAKNDFLYGNDIYPLAIRIMDNKVDSGYYTYKAIGSKAEDPRVIIYAHMVENELVVIY